MNAAIWVAIIAVVCFAVALLTSHVLVRWILPEEITAGLGNSSRFISLDGVRGYLAFGVYVHHCIFTWAYLRTGAWSAPNVNFENQLGRASCAVFFMITAFLFWGRRVQRRMDWKAFFISRFFRIYPLYLFVLLIICLGVAWKTHWTAVQPPRLLAKEILEWVLFRILSINGYSQTYLIVAGVTWTLLYEAWFYLSFPFLALIFLEKNAIWKKIIALAIVIALFKVNYLSKFIAPTFLGGIAAVYWRGSKERVDLARSKFGTVIGLASLAFVLFFLHEPFNFLGITLLTVFFIVVASGNLLLGALKTKSALWMGEISYSIYLCHGAILWIVLQNIVPRSMLSAGTMPQFAMAAIGITPLIIFFSTATYLLIERPFIGLGHRLARRGRESAQESARNAPVLRDDPALN